MAAALFGLARSLTLLELALTGRLPVLSSGPAAAVVTAATASASTPGCGRGSVLPGSGVDVHRPAPPAWSAGALVTGALSEINSPWVLRELVGASPSGGWDKILAALPRGFVLPPALVDKLFGSSSSEWPARPAGVKWSPNVLPQFDAAAAGGIGSASLLLFSSGGGGTNTEGDNPGAGKNTEGDNPGAGKNTEGEAGKNTEGDNPGAGKNTEGDPYPFRRGKKSPPKLLRELVNDMDNKLDRIEGNLAKDKHLHMLLKRVIGDKMGRGVIAVFSLAHDLYNVTFSSLVVGVGAVAWVTLELTPSDAQEMAVNYLRQLKDEKVEVLRRLKKEKAHLPTCTVDEPVPVDPELIADDQVLPSPDGVAVACIEDAEDAGHFGRSFI